MIKKRTQRKYLAEFVYGSIDGTITTFAVVMGAIGASLSSGVILIMGFANLFADGFSMAISNYMATKSQKEVEELHKHKSNDKKEPNKTAFTTFFSFIAIGITPLLPFLIALVSPSLNEIKIYLSIVFTALAFLVIGAIKGKVIGKNRIKSALVTLVMGGVAAILAFLVGHLLQGLVT